MEKIPGYPMYAITKDGMVYSFKNKRFLKPHTIKTGLKKKQRRQRVQLFNKDGHKNLFVHRLVAMTYLPNPDNLPVVNHIDCNTMNNHADNLEWCTDLHNVRHAIENHRHQSVKNRVLTDDTVRQIRKMYISQTISSIARELNLDRSTVSQMLHGMTYRDVM